METVLLRTHNIVITERIEEDYILWSKLKLTLETDQSKQRLKTCDQCLLKSFMKY